MVLTSDHITGATGVTPTVTIAKNNGAFASPQGAVTELGNGWYSVAANATDANTLGPLILHAEAGTCDPTDDVFDIVSYNPMAFAPVTTPAGPEAVSALEIISDAFEIIGVLSQGESLGPTETSKGLRRLNQTIGQMSLLPLTMTATVRETFTLQAGKGTPANPYTVGIGGDFDTTRPTSLDAVAIYVTSASQPFEIARSVMTDAAYQSIPLKTLTSPYFEAAYLSATYASGWASLYLYPIPTELNDIVLYRKAQIAAFPNLSAPVDLPPGAADDLTYRLARRLAILYSREWSGQMESEANDAAAMFQRMNTRMVDLTLDAGLISQPARLYDIESDT